MHSALPERANLLGVRVSVTDYAEVTRCVVAAAREQRSLTVSAAAFGAVLDALDVVAPDGQPVRWGLTLTRQARLLDRVYGPTLMLRVCEAAAAQALPVFLFGSSDATLAQLSRKLVQRIPSLAIAGVRASRFRDATPDEQLEDAAAIVASGARLCFVGLGCPRQEWWMFHQRTRLPMPLLGVGAAFDLHAGLRAMAPPALQAAGLEWAFRLAQEPRRLWRRYLTLNPRYAARLLQQIAYPASFGVPSTDPAQARSRPCPG
jgi:N-acetylglucosaminyldiphosphoundecaprenol N-acetyl-beta-D-mannosaminyltransferase